MHRLYALILTISLPLLSFSQANIPSRMDFCGIDITLDAGARDYIAGVVKQLKRSPTYFDKLVDIAHMHLPHVERAFREEGVPDDMKYIGLQESAFRGDAVSSSGAVGYWQFKAPAARVAGLTVNGDVDERMHLYRASRGAARYFTYCNKDFDNWLYAIIGYNRGPAGALAHIDKKYYGARKMPVTKNTHWYALKAIAHKIAFEDALKSRPATGRLDEIPVKAGSSMADWAKSEGVPVETLQKYNHWLKARKVPAEGSFTCMVPREGPPVLVKNDKPQKEEPIVKPQPVAVASIPDERVRGKFLERNIFKDSDYGDEFAVVENGEMLVNVAVKFGVKYKRLLEWNDLRSSVNAEPGEIIYLKKPKKARFHIVQPGETLLKVAHLHETDIDKLVKINRLKNGKAMLYAGQKLYLKGKRPKNERIILLLVPGASTNNEVQEVKPPQTPPVRSEGKSPVPKAGKTVVHTVKSGETLWGISQKYGVSVAEIKQFNSLRSNEIFVGQKLRVK